MSYASMIIGGKRQPKLPLAIHIFRTTGWRHPVIVQLTDAEIGVMEKVEQWSPRAAEGIAA